ncbi:MAG: ABC transporter permease [Firmicutes bacterium]|nr:ABC transporter permease [Bacillota bacterium]
MAMFLTGDPAALMLGEGASQAQIAEFRHRMGFDRPLLVQYGSFLARAAVGDFGMSLHFNQPNLQLVLERLPATIQLASISLLIGTTLAIPLGVMAAVHRNSWLDTLLMGVALVGQATPGFWLGIMLILVFAVNLGWFPASGRGTIAHLVLPALTLAVFPLASNVRLMRSSTLEVLHQDFVKTARAKGLKENIVLFKHVLRNALSPVLTMVGIQIGSFMGGAVITETIYSWPGVGRLVVQAIMTKDFPLVQTVVAFLALVFVAVNLLIDIAYTLVDPRVRY